MKLFLSGCSLLFSIYCFSQQTDKQLCEEAIKKIKKEYVGCSLPLLKLENDSLIGASVICADDNFWAQLPGRDTVFPVLQPVFVKGNKTERIVYFYHYLYVKRGATSFLQFTYSSRYYFNRPDSKCNYLLDKMEEWNENMQLMTTKSYLKESNELLTRH